MLAVVPARAGSKRLPGKNFRPFLGASLVARAALQALALNFVSRVVVSSDTREGVDIPPQAEFIMRSAELARDDTSSQELARHLWGVCGKGRRGLLWLQPTSPLRSLQDLQAAHTLWGGEGRVVSATPGAGRHARLVRAGKFLETGVPRCDGDLEVNLNGAIYILDPESLQAEDWVGGARAYLMPPERSVDIDTQEDWDEAIRMGQEQP
ncbi:MAG: hypothetical protein AB7F75_11300 [Planctomycetota bacterium]